MVVSKILLQVSDLIEMLVCALLIKVSISCLRIFCANGELPSVAFAVI